MNHSQEFLAIVNDARSRIQEIDIDTYRTLLSEGTPHLLIDVREESEYAAGHAKGSFHLSKGVIERDIVAKVPDKQAKLVLYCGGGFRSALAADSLRKMGYTDAISLDGGWRAYTGAGLPVEP